MRLQFYKKLTIPFDNNRNAKTQERKIHGVKKIERIKVMKAIKSTALRMSPCRMNNPFKSKRPEVKSVSCKIGEMLKIIINNSEDANMSIAPRIFTSIKI